MTRKVIGILIGVVVGLAFTGALQGLAEYVFAPAALDPTDPVQAGQMMAQMPLPGLIGVLGARFLAPLFGGFVGAKVAHARWAAWTTTALIGVVTVMRAVMQHHPVWLVVASLLVIALAGRFAGAWAGDPEPEEAEDREPPTAPWTAPQAAPAPEPAYADPDPVEPATEPEPEIVRPRYASFDELRAAAPAPPEPEPELEPEPSPEDRD
jgi:hypothetical protein